MERLPSISILGCGWFGLPLAKQLVVAGYEVKGSTTSPDKLALLRTGGIEAYLVQLPLDGINNGLTELVDSDILVFNIPPKGKPEQFIENVSQLIPLLTQVKEVIFISSTSVYGDSNSTVTEETVLSPETESGKALAEAEGLLKAQNGFDTTIVRFAGLVGPGRHPGRFLAGKKNLANGLAPVNLLHLDDCVGVVQEIITKKAFGHTFNACSPSHPTRKEFYTQAANALGLESPEFISEKINWKIIESTQSSALLNYQYKVDDWMKWVNE